MRKEEDEEKPEDQAKVKADKGARKPKVVETDEELEDNALLGEATLAKMSAAAEAETETKKVENEPVVEQNPEQAQQEG